MTNNKLVVIISALILSTGILFTSNQSTSAYSPANSNPPIDFSQVNWTELGRLIYGKCGEYHDLAIQAGWPESQWPTLSKVMYRESRCNTFSFNKSDPNGGSRGLIQINGYWCRKNKYNPNGWLQQKSILNNCEDLFDPYTNLRAGWAMWQYSQERNGCGWRPWSTRCK
jgi:hypothetical protein